MVLRMDSLPTDLSSATLHQFVGTITKEPDQVQSLVLSAILEQNVGCDYLSKHGFRKGTTMDRAAFKARLPVIEYEDIKEDIQRIAEGEKSPLLCLPPVSEFFTSSGTSGGARKFFPSIVGDKFRKNVNDAISIAFLDREVPGLQRGKALYLFTVRKSIETKSGLLAHTVLTRAFKDIFAPGAVNPYRGTVTSPGEVFLCPEENNQVIYCHLLCALLQRRSVVRVRAIFASFLVRAFRFLLESWPAMCHDIRHGKLHPRVKDPAMRAAVEELLAVAIPRLADDIEGVMSAGAGSGFEALIPRLFPSARIVEGITTGSMAAYTPMLEQLAGGLPIISMHYGASEGYFGVNLEPLCPPSQVKYTLMPFLNFFEFIPMRRDPVTWATHPAVEDIVDLAGVEDGQDYELVVTTFTGLYRYRVGDILRVKGFHNNCPQFEFVGRKNVVLSIDTDKTEEGDLHHALTSALDVLLAQVHEHNVHTQLLDYTSFADVESNPGHYVIFMELCGVGEKEVGELVAEEQLREYCVQFCENMERGLSCIYSRNRHEGIIGPLELRLVTKGSFDLLASAAVAKGAEIGQYKTPRCLKALSDVATLNSRLQLTQVVVSGSLP